MQLFSNAIYSVFGTAECEDSDLFAITRFLDTFIEKNNIYIHNVLDRLFSYAIYSVYGTAEGENSDLFAIPRFLDTFIGKNNITIHYV